MVNQEVAVALLPCLFRVPRSLVNKRRPTDITSCPLSRPQMLVVGDASDIATPSGEAADGVTPPMRNVQK